MRKVETVLKQRCVVIFFAFVLSTAVLSANNISRVQANARATAATQEASRRLAIKLRSFVIGASGTLHFEPTMSGGKVRLTVLGLPRPAGIMPDGSAYFVWATAPGARPFRVGELPIDKSGNGGLEFVRPEFFERYSVVVTVETSSAADYPGGVMIFASPARVVTPFFGEANNAANNDRRRNLAEMDLGRRTQRQRRANDFYTEVDDALNAQPFGSRLLELFGEEIAPGAYGLARVTVRDAKGYARAVFKSVPLPSMVGANTYILWAIMPNGRIIYMGSLPNEGLNNSDIYVRVAGFNSNDFDLFVTAEVRRPAARPSARRALSSREQRTGPR